MEEIKTENKTRGRYKKGNEKTFMYSEDTLIFNPVQWTNLKDHNNTIMSVEHYNEKIYWIAKNILNNGIKKSKNKDAKYAEKFEEAVNYLKQKFSEKMNGKTFELRHSPSAFGWDEECFIFDVK